MTQDHESHSFDSPITLGASIVIPSAIFQKMAQCYYGFGPRAWETPENRQIIIPVTTASHTTPNTPVKATPGSTAPDPEIVGASLSMMTTEIPAGWQPRGHAARPMPKRGT